ncbi:ArnT family glycosyltransferase [Dactylosporangium sp. CA-092794]|uniref:ArnT family glycosyltransferase n=1 Tax=Dactylosporangium sp. CA-092794 TaxID=3239929 RepID=UPI003D8FE92D
MPRIIAALFVAIELALSGRYGFFPDELYFIQAGRHPAFGYVDQPPLVPLLSRITDLLGPHPAAVRIIPALAGAATVLIAARLAALFGGGPAARTLAALTTACAPFVFALAHLGITETLDLLAWAAVLLLVSEAILLDRPRRWLGAGAAAGLGLQTNNLVLLLLLALTAGLLSTPRGRAELRTRWPWLGAAIAALIWLPNVLWQATHGWPQLAMAAALHQQHSTVASYIGAVPAQVFYAGVPVAPLLVAGYVSLWRRPELRFLGIAATLLVVYVIAWIPGKPYYAEGTAPVVLAAAAVAAERWVTRGSRPRLRRAAVIAAPLLAAAVTIPAVLPVLPPERLHSIAGLNRVTTADTVGWPGYTRAVAAEVAALAAAGRPPTSIFTANYGEAAALEVLGDAETLPPVLSGHNHYWLWGPGTASNETVLVVDALDELRAYFADCHQTTTYQVPDEVPSDFAEIPIGVCTGPTAGWPALWPNLRHYGGILSTGTKDRRQP